MSESIHAAAGAPQIQAEAQTQATGTPQAQPEPNAGRGPDDRFAKGNPGGPGDLFARQRAARHQAFLEQVSVEQIRAIANKLLAMAWAGNLAAAKLLFLYAIGKPQPAVEPDSRDLEEWQHPRAAADLIRELPRAGVEVPLEMARAARTGSTSDMARLAAEAFPELQPGQPATCPPLDRLADMKGLGILAGGKRQAATSGKKRQDPTPNGFSPVDQAANLRVVTRIPHP